jgi:hypothetical protein
VTVEELQDSWRELNARYFSNSLPPIDIVWSRRLTASAGLFVSHGGPRTIKFIGLKPKRRVIRLSAPLLEGSAPESAITPTRPARAKTRAFPVTPARHGRARDPLQDPLHFEEQRVPQQWVPRPFPMELTATLAHEMIHQWQFDILKRHPDHGPDFHKKMEELNRDGLGITIRHDLTEAVRRWVKYAWRCLGCGRLYERQRRTIRPGRHRCGACRGRLREVPHEGLKSMPPLAGSRRRGANVSPQLALDLWMP